MTAGSFQPHRKAMFADRERVQCPYAVRLCSDSLALARNCFGGTPKRLWKLLVKRETDWYPQS